MYTGDYQLSPDPALELLSSGVPNESSGVIGQALTDLEDGKRFGFSRYFVGNDSFKPIPNELPIPWSQDRAFVAAAS
jgi:hypothetical protein